MSEQVRRVLELFEALSEEDRDAALNEMLRRFPPGAPDMTDEERDMVAQDLLDYVETEDVARATKR